MQVLRPVFFAALLAGLLAGGASTVFHQFGAVPLILQAEAFEQAAPALPHAPHNHAEAIPAHSHDAEAWEPGEGLERTAYTLVADLLTGIAYAFLLVGLFTLRGVATDGRQGLFWGLAGFAVFTLAPGLGLPPELPGTEAGPLPLRQLWWLATVLMTGGGLALLVFTRQLLWALPAAVLLVLPHLYGAPQPEVFAMLAPEALAHRFMVVVTVTSLLFWLILGGTAGWLYNRLLRT